MGKEFGGDGIGAIAKVWFACFDTRNREILIGEEKLKSDVTYMCYRKDYRWIDIIEANTFQRGRKRRD